MKLYHKDRLIGTVTNITPEDTFDMSGDIELSPIAEEYKAMFAYLTDEDSLNSGAEPPFEESYLDDWFLEDEHGVRKEIGCPGIYYEDREVLWRE